MGIKKLNKFLESYQLIDQFNNFTELKKYLKIDKPLLLGIDASLYLYKYSYSLDNFLKGFILQITKMLTENVIPIYIFEGEGIFFKNETIKARISKRNKIKELINELENNLQTSEDDLQKKELENLLEKTKKKYIKILPEDINNLKKILDYFNLPYFNAQYEADNLCAFLQKNKYLDCILSEDMDILVYGCNQQIKIENNQIYLYQLPIILKTLDINYQKFIEMCCLFGSDYIKPIPKLEPEKIYQEIKNTDIITFINNINLEHIMPKLKEVVDSEEFNLEYGTKFTRDYQDYFEIINLYLNNDNLEKKTFYIPTYKGFDYHKIISFINTLNLFKDSFEKKKIFFFINKASSTFYK